MIFEDSVSDDAKAVSAANKLIDMDGVNVIYSAFTGPGIAVAPIAADNNILHLYEAASTKPAKSFPNNAIKIGYYLYESDCVTLAKYANEHNLDNIDYIFAQKDFSSECLKGFSSEFKGNILTQNAFLPSKEDFASILTKISDSNSDAILVTGYNADFVNLYKKMIELGNTKPVLCAASEDCLMQDSNNLPPGGLTYFSADVNSAFRENFLKKYPNSTDTDIINAATLYDVVFDVYSSAKECPLKQKDCLFNAIINSKIKKSIANKGFVGNMFVYQVSVKTVEKEQS